MTDAPPVNPTDTGTPPPADFKATLPDDLKNDPGLAKYTQVEALARGYINAQRMIGADKIVIPKDGDADGWNKAYDALGRPKDGASYQFADVKLPDGMEYDKELEGKFRETAHTLGLSQKQALAMRDWWAAHQSEMFSSSATAHAAQREQATNELKRELGAAYDGYAKAAEAALLHFGGKEVLDAVKANGLINDPFMIKIFGKVGKETLGEEKLKAAGVVPEDGPQELKTKIADFRSQHAAALYDNMHPEHARRVEELTGLTTRLYGNIPVSS